MENANHKPGGGDKKIETIKTDFKDKAKPKVGSKDNVKHAPGGGDIKVRCAPKKTHTYTQNLYMKKKMFKSQSQYSQAKKCISKIVMIWKHV